MRRLGLTGLMICVFVGGVFADEEKCEPIKIAAICTAYADYWHADVIVTKFLAGFPTDDGLLEPQVKIASLYLDQESHDNLGRKIAAHYDIPIYSTITEALTLGGEKLAVDGVIIIGEHGDYPRSRLGAKMYPRMRMAEEVFRAFEFSGRSVPVFIDKHLSYNWLDSKWIYDRAKELEVPMMAGSCIPLTWRDPPLEHPRGVKIDEAVVLLHAHVDIYAVHGMEMLQTMIERRSGGETGIKSVQCLQGEAFYEALENGRIPMELIEAAANTLEDKKPGHMRDHDLNPIGIILEFVDGLRATVIMSYANYGYNWAYAARIGDKIEATQFAHRGKPEGAPSVPTFSYQSLNIQKMFLTGQPQYPIERTLLSSGVVDAALRSIAADGKIIKTPHLHIRYRPYNFDPIRPKNARPINASLMDWPPKEIKHLYQED